MIRFGLVLPRNQGNCALKTTGFKEFQVQIHHPSSLAIIYSQLGVVGDVALIPTCYSSHNELIKLLGFIAYYHVCIVLGPLNPNSFISPKFGR